MYQYRLQGDIGTQPHLFLELFDLIIQHKLELLQFLILLLQFIDPPLLVSDGFITLTDLTLQTSNVLLKTWGMCNSGLGFILKIGLEHV